MTKTKLNHEGNCKKLKLAVSSFLAFSLLTISACAQNYLLLIGSDWGATVQNIIVSDDQGNQLISGDSLASGNGKYYNLTVTPGTHYTFTAYDPVNDVNFYLDFYPSQQDGEIDIIGPPPEYYEWGGAISSPTVTILTSSSPSGGGTTGGGGTVNSGSSVTVTATAASGYSFVNWTEITVPVSTSASYSFTANASQTLVANFVPIQYTITTSPSPSNGGTTSGGGTANGGSNVTVTATPVSGYTFANWTEGGTVVSTSASYTFTVSGNRTLVANFTYGYQTLSGNVDDFTFEAGKTYYVSDYVYLVGDSCTIEGGTVIKFARGAGLDSFVPVSCQTSPDKPAILTAVDDNTVGDIIDGSTGNPSGTYADVALAVETGTALTPFQNLRISYANMGLGCNTNVFNCQFVDVDTAILPEVDVTVGNVLLYNVDTAFESAGGSTINAAFITAHHVNTLVSSGITLNITNSLFICVTNIGTITGIDNAANSNDIGVFTIAGLASHYLADNTYRNIGTTAVDSDLLANIQQRTTYAPYDGGYPDTNTPDLGYHYPSYVDLSVQLTDPVFQRLTNAYVWDLNHAMYSPGSYTYDPFGGGGTGSYAANYIPAANYPSLDPFQENNGGFYGISTAVNLQLLINGLKNNGLWNKLYSLQLAMGNSPGVDAVNIVSTDYTLRWEPPASWWTSHSSFQVSHYVYDANGQYYPGYAHTGFVASESGGVNIGTILWVASGPMDGVTLVFGGWTSGFDSLLFESAGNILGAPFGNAVLGGISQGNFYGSAASYPLVLSGFYGQLPDEPASIINGITNQTGFNENFIALARYANTNLQFDFYTSPFSGFGNGNYTNDFSIGDGHLNEPFNLNSLNLNGEYPTNDLNNAIVTPADSEILFGQNGVFENPVNIRMYAIEHDMTQQDLRIFARLMERFTDINISNAFWLYNGFYFESNDGNDGFYFENNDSPWNFYY